MNKAYRIRHNRLGRLRLSFRNNYDLNQLSNYSAGLPGVIHVRTNPVCSSLVINYDIQLLSCNDLIKLINEQLKSGMQKPVATKHCALPKKDESRVSLCACSDRDSLVKREFRRFVGLSGVMAYVFVKEVLLKRVVVQAAFSPLGIVSLIAAWPLLKGSFKGCSKDYFSMEKFLAAGCVAATLSGQALTAIEILWIHGGAETLKAWVAERSRKAVSSILDLTAKNTFILVGDVEVEMPVSAVKPRDVVVLHTGEKVSVDGEVIYGEAMIDDSPLTGRAELNFVSEGERVYAGSYVREGLIRVRAEAVGDLTYLSRIMHQVEDCIVSRAPIESVADRLASNLLKLGLVATAGTLFFTGSLWRAFTVMLVMACPCATALSAQTAVSAAISAAAQRGVLIKGGRYLEEVGNAEIICFDKTGTLTTNQPRVEVILNFSYFTEDEILRWAYSAEMHNHHPLAKALVSEAQHRNIDPIPHVECDFTLGKGVKAIIGKDTIRLGNMRYLSESGISVESVMDQVIPLFKRGLTVVFLAKNDKILAVLGFANELRPDARATIDRLYASGASKIALITGDSKNTAVDLCQHLGINDCRHSVLPEEKGKIVRELKNGGNGVIMVGDGINDALALAEADVGIAMSADGADVAIEAADIALVSDDLSDIVYVRELSRKTISIAKQNFWIATSTNIGGALAGALGVLSPVGAGLLHIIHTLGVLANSSRLLLRDKNDKLKQKPIKD